MPRFIVERNIPHADKLTAQELQNIAVRSNAAIDALGEPYTWITSYVAGNKIYCIHEAGSADVVYRHAQTGKFPADMVTEIAAIIGPDTAETTPARPPR